MFDEMVALAMLEERKRRAEAVILLDRESRPERRADEDRMSAWEKLKELIEGSGESAVVVPATARVEAASWGLERSKRS